MIVTNEQLQKMDFTGAEVILVKPAQVSTIEANYTAAHLNLQIVFQDMDVTVMAKGEDAGKILASLRAGGQITDEMVRGAVVITKRRQL